MSDAENKTDLISERIEQKGFSDFPCRETVWGQMEDDWVLNGAESVLTCRRYNEQQIITTDPTTTDSVITNVP